MRRFGDGGFFAFSAVLAVSIVSAAAPGARADASACDDAVDLREAGRPLAGLVPVSQGYEDTNLCGFYAFGAYLDAYRVSRLGQRGDALPRASAVAIGVDNAIRAGFPYWFPVQNSTDPLAMRIGRWGSTFCGLAESVREIGYCASEDLPSRTLDETARFADLTTAFYGRLLEIAETGASRRTKAIADAMPELYGKYLGWQGAQRKARARAPASAAMAQDAMRAVIEKHAAHPYEAIRKIFFPNCAQPFDRNHDFGFKSCEGELYVGLDVTGIPSRDEDPWRTDRASRRVHELLSRPNAMPIPFAYCSQVLEEGKAYDGASPIGVCGIHWSLIAGRRKIGGECHLLVRNSWNPDDEKDYSKDWTLDRGDIWVRERELTRSMLMAQWLEE